MTVYNERRIETTKQSILPAVPLPPLPAVGRKDKINEHVGTGLDLSAAENKLVTTADD